MNIKLANQDVEIVTCKECGKNMVNIDADQLAPGDLSILKQEYVRISNPHTESPVCIKCEVTGFWEKVGDFLDDIDTDSDDSSFFSGSSFGESSSFGGGSSFGGFGGGSFSGGGASRGF